MFNKFKNKTIIITGHTGFKGSWLTLWLKLLGAKIVGISINLPSKPSHYEELNLSKEIISIKQDIRNLKKLEKIFQKISARFCFSLSSASACTKIL